MTYQTTVKWRDMAKLAEQFMTVDFMGLAPARPLALEKRHVSSWLKQGGIRAKMIGRIAIPHGRYQLQIEFADEDEFHLFRLKWL